MLDLRRILVPTDFSLSAQKALRYGIEFAKKFDAEVILVHVVEPPAYARRSDEDATDWCREQLEQQARDEIPEAVKRRVLLVRGTPYVEVAGAAEREDADLIVVATRGRSGLKDVLLGSTTERLLRRAPCPVMIVRDDERDFITPAGDEEKWRDG
jgi:nucleotide-binding universal stress UspA family protein